MKAVAAGLSCVVQVPVAVPLTVGCRRVAVVTQFVAYELDAKNAEYEQLLQS